MKNHEVTLCCANPSLPGVPGVCPCVTDLQQSSLCQRCEQVPYSGRIKGAFAGVETRCHSGRIRGLLLVWKRAVNGRHCGINPSHCVWSEHWAGAELEILISIALFHPSMVVFKTFSLECADLLRKRATVRDGHAGLYNLVYTAEP